MSEQTASNREPQGGKGTSGTVTRPVRDTLRRYRVVRRLSAILDLTLGPLALATLTLLIVELLFHLSEPWASTVYWAQITIWGVFIVAFVIEMALAPRKLLYLKRNWLLVIALAVPALRVLRAAQALRFLRASRVVRGAALLRGFTTLNRSMSVIRSFFSFSQMAFLAALTAVVWLAAAALVYYLERGTGSGIAGAGDALWWAATVITTVASAEEPESTEGRVVAVALRIFGLAVFGYFTARLAAFFLGASRQPELDRRADDLDALRREIERLREALEVDRTRRP